MDWLIDSGIVTDYWLNHSVYDLGTWLADALNQQLTHLLTH